MEENIKKAYEELKALIKYHNDRYYNQDDPEITDYEYDQLAHKLRDMESQWPELISEDSNTQKVGGVANENSTKVQHDVPMLSLLDVFDPAEVESFVEKLANEYPMPNMLSNRKSMAFPFLSSMKTEN